MAMLLHFFEVPDAQDLVASYVAALAPGSYVVLTMGLVAGEEGRRVLPHVHGRWPDQAVPA